nr:MAG TPA: GSG1-like protein [Caudoviricetes sp.]
MKYPRNPAPKFIKYGEEIVRYSWETRRDKDKEPYCNN